MIGPKGNTLQEILDKTGVSVEIPPSDSSSETIILRGEPDRLGQALTEVYAKVKSVTGFCSTWIFTYFTNQVRCNAASVFFSHRLIATLLVWYLLLLGFIASSLARKDKTWPRSPNKCPRFVNTAGCLPTFGILFHLI